MHDLMAFLSIIITWCNNNTGFLSAILSLIGVVLSIIAIVVSLRMARLPYKKKVKLSASMSIRVFQDIFTDVIQSEVEGVTVNAVNVGSRNVNITYFGFAVRDGLSRSKQMKMNKIRDNVTGTGIIVATEIASEMYDKDDLVSALRQKGKRARVFLCASDSEGKEYYKGHGNVKSMLKSLSKSGV